MNKENVEMDVFQNIIDALILLQNGAYDAKLEHRSDERMQISYDSFIDAVDKCIDTVKDHAYSYDNGWPFVSKKDLPPEPNKSLMDEFSEYIVLIEGASIPTALQYAGNGCWCDSQAREFYAVFAWKPFPGIPNCFEN